MNLHMWTLCDVLFGDLFLFVYTNMATKSLFSVDFEVFGKVQGTALINTLINIIGPSIRAKYFVFVNLPVGF